MMKILLIILSLAALCSCYQKPPQYVRAMRCTYVENQLDCKEAIILNPDWEDWKKEAVEDIGHD